MLADIQVLVKVIDLWELCDVEISLAEAVPYSVLHLVPRYFVPGRRHAKALFVQSLGIHISGPTCWIPTAEEAEASRYFTGNNYTLNVYSCLLR